MRRLLLTAGLLTLAGCSRSAEYPSKPILIVCPWAQGGGTDRVARQVAALLEEDLKVNVNVLNATGGEGVTGHGQGATAKPDGYTLTLMTVEINMLRWRGRTKLSYRDFTPALLINRDSAALFVRQDSPWKTLKDLETEIRRAPGALRASGTAQGGIWHVALAGWLTTIGLKPTDITWVASQGSAPALKDLLAKGNEIVCTSLGEARTFLDGEVRCLGIMADERLAQFPGIATFREQGAPWTMGVWRGIGLPRGVPRRVLEVIVPALERIVRSKPYLDYMKTEGFGAACEPPAEFERSLEATDERMRALLTSETYASLSKGAFSPMMFPSILGGILAAVFAGLVATRQLRVEGGTVALGSGGWIRFAEGLLFIAAYALLSDVAGFLLTAGPLVFLALWRLGTRPVVAAPIAAAVVVAAYAVFGKALRVPLPRRFLEW